MLHSNDNSDCCSFPSFKQLLLYAVPQQLLFYVVPQSSDKQSLILGVLPPGLNIIVALSHALHCHSRRHRKLSQICAIYVVFVCTPSN